MKDRLIYVVGQAADSDNVGAFLRAGSDGDLISSTLIGGKEALDVNIVGGADSGIFAEDSAHVSGHNGQFVMGVRNDANATLTSTDGDYSPLATDLAGRLKVVANVTSNTEYAEDSAHTTGAIGNFVLAVRNDVQGSLAGTDGDYAPIQVDALGRVRTITDLDLSGDLVGDDDVDSEDPLKVGSRSVAGPLAALSAAGDKANVISDLYRRVYTLDTANIALVSTQQNVDNVGEVELAATALAGRRKLFIQNLAVNRDIYIGATGVTTADGFQIRRGSTWEFAIGQNVNFFAIGVDATVADVRLLELA